MSYNFLSLTVLVQLIAAISLASDPNRIQLNDRKASIFFQLNLFK